MVYVNQLEGALNAVQQECPAMLSLSEVQKHLRDHLFHGLCKQLPNSMHYPRGLTQGWSPSEIGSVRGKGWHCESEEANCAAASGSAGATENHNQ